MTIRTLVFTGILMVAAATAAAAGQDPLASARELYASARYDEALATLDGLRESTVTTTLDRRAIEQYRSLCLLALGRNGEADAAIAAVVRTDPFFVPGERDASPRVRNAYTDVRRRMLPQIANERYQAAKVTWDRKDYPEAADLFREAVALIDDPDMQGQLKDLRTIAAGFLELAATLAKPPEAPKPAEPVRAPEPARPTPARIYVAEDPNVIQPVVLRQDMPKVPAPVLARARERGIVEVVVNEQGRVQEASVRLSVHPMYDSLVMAAAREWRYQPATVNGVPVKFRKRIQIAVARKE
ncbi:MAG: energy transducer TonB [Vicinamibacterales bacterium]